jgi:hypothetical protein
MPTTLPSAFADAAARLERHANLGIANNGDFAVIAALTVIALAFAISLSVLFPQVTNAVDLALIVT